ncbi:MAG: hypothetical protein AAFX05_06350 [Planctomycetota bacterium]
MAESNDFYVGYLPTPPRDRRFLRIAVPLLLWCGVAVSGAVAWRMNDPGNGVWNTDDTMQWEGTLHERPYPLLEMDDEAGQRTMVMLVTDGKRGVQEWVTGLDGNRVRISGFEIRRDGRRMLALPGDDAIDVLGQAESMARSQGATDVTLRGEIVDSKCFLGAMKPGEGRGHKPCAVLCIQGGIPAVLVARNAEGEASYTLLTDATGTGPFDDALLRHVAEPVEVQGVLRQLGDLDVLAIQSVRRR